MVKININESVLFAATERIDWAFDNFSHVCISFSGGKDSTVLLHLAGYIARKKKRNSACCLLTGKCSLITQ